MGEERKGLFDEEAEKAVLGCMLMDEGAAAQGRSLLTPEDFYVPLYRTVFQALQTADPPNIIGVGAELRRMGEWERVGLDWLTKIAMSVSTSVHIRKYTEKLQKLTFFRQVVLAAGEMMQAAHRQDMDGISKGLEAIRGGSVCGDDEGITLAEATAAYIREVAELRARGQSITGLSTGFRELDGALGGLRDGEMTILAARPSMGKSALALDIARNVQRSLAAEKERVLVFSLEMTAKSLGGRGYTSEYMLPNDTFAVGKNNAVWQGVLADIERNSEEYEKGVGRLIICESGGQTVPKIDAFCHRQKAKGLLIRLIVVDYLQLIQGKGQDRVREIGSISRGLKQLARDWKCPVLVLSQLSRKCEERADHRPILSDLRDGGDIEQDADTVLFLYRDEYYYADTERKGLAELNIAKQRNGPIGRIELDWIPNSTTFRNAGEYNAWKATQAKAPKEWEE